MRELKFRVWDKLTEKFIYPTKYHQWHYISISDGKFYNLQNSSGGDDYVVHQSTGLKDKSGKEIYEGDIVKVSRCHTKSVEVRPNQFRADLIEDGVEIGLVLWATYAYEYMVSYEHKRYDDTEKLMSAPHRYEIIGNIFENPELICAN